MYCVFMFTIPVFVSIGGDVFLFSCCIVKKKQQKMSGVRRAGKITKGGTGQVKELPLVVRAKGLWERLRRCVCQPCLSVSLYNTRHCVWCRHDLKKEERVKVRNQLLELLTSHIHKVQSITLRIT